MKQKQILTLLKSQYKIIFLLFILCLGNIDAYSQSTEQEQKITGVLVNEKGEFVDYANVILLNRIDSTFVSGCVSEQNGAFYLKNLRQGEYLLKVSLIGCDDYYKSISFQGGLLDCGEVSLKLMYIYWKKLPLLQLSR